ncbi:MAG: YceH family protein, partial [Planctomycetota bacterium]
MSEASADSPVPLTAIARRCLGVLVEKAKTTPDSYPLSASALVSGCNQKSNRAPVMSVVEGDVLVALDELRSVGAAREIHGNGRVVKYRHAAYEWLGVDSPGASIMTELLLRGPQTLGEIRSRASRMHSFADLDAVRVVVEDLESKDLVQAVSPAGRGQQFAHKLYTAEENQHMIARVQKQAPAPKMEPGIAAAPEA